MNADRPFRIMPGDVLPNGYQCVGVINTRAYTFRHPDHPCDVTMVEGSLNLRQFESEEKQ